MGKLEHITLPTAAEKDSSIQQILDYGMPPPRRLSHSLVNLFQSVGLRGLVFGLGDCIFLSLLACGLLWLGLFAAFQSSSSLICVLLFFASPFLYAALHLITTWKEIMNGTYEQMMTCQYNLRQLTVLRMLLFGGCSVMLTVAVSGLVAVLFAHELSALRILGVSCSALFLYAAGSLFAEWKGRAPGAFFVVPLLWTALFLAFFFSGERGALLLLRLPTAVFWGLTVAALALYIWVLNHLYFDSKEGALTHAVS